MSDKAKKQRQDAANKMRNLVSKSSELEDGDPAENEASDDELVYYVDTKDDETPEHVNEVQQESEQEPVKKRGKKASGAGANLDVESKVEILMNHMYDLVEDRKKRQNEKEKKAKTKEEKEKIFKELTEDWRDRMARKQHYSNVLNDKQKALFDAVKF